jgi:hypothetical protein
VKWRVEAIVQIIQTKTKPNKIKPPTDEEKKNKNKQKPSSRSLNDPVYFSTLFKFTSSASVFTFSTETELKLLKFFPPILSQVPHQKCL